MYPQDPRNPNPNTHVRLQQVLTNIYRYYHDAMLDKWLTKTACIVQPTFLKVLTASLDSNLVFVSPRQNSASTQGRCIFHFLCKKFF